MVQILFDTDDGYPVNIDLNFCTHNLQRFCKINTTKGYIKLDIKNQYLSWNLKI